VYLDAIRAFWVTLVVVVAAVVLWRVGEAHKQACIRAGKVNCSVLPWSGDAPGAGAGGGGGGVIQGVDGVPSSINGLYSRGSQSIP